MQWHLKANKVGVCVCVCVDGGWWMLLYLGLEEKRREEKVE